MLRFRVYSVIVILCAVLGLVANWPVQGMAQSSAGYETKARQAIVIDARTGRVLFEKDADALIPPASMSKLMTMIMVFEQLEAGKLNLDQTFTVNEDAWRRGGAMSGGSTMYAELNSAVRVEDLIKGAVVQSANDACIIFADNLADSESAFAAQMTERAHALGAKTASFRNATGLPEDGHEMSVRDLAVMARHIITAFPERYRYYSMPEFTWNNINQQNRNPLLKDYPGADGMKTGYTKEAGYGLVGSAMRDGRRLIIVIAGLKSLNERRQEAQSLLDWGFRQFRSVDVYAKGDRIGKARVWGGIRRSVDLVAMTDVRVSLSTEEQETAEVELTYTGPLIAPVEAGRQIGSVRLMVDGFTVANVPVATASAVAEETSMWSRAVDSLAIMIFGS